MIVESYSWLATPGLIPPPSIHLTSYTVPSMAVNTTNFSSPVHTRTSSASTRLLISQNGPPFSLYSQFKPSPSFPSLSLKPSSFFYKAPKPRSIATVAAAAPGDLSQTEAISVPSDFQQALGAFPSEAGVYAVFDGDGELQFIGISRNIAASIVGHRKSQPELCCSIKFGVVEEPDRTTLTQAWKSWMEEHIKTTGKIPPGNETGNITWTKQAPRKKPDLRLTPGRHVQLTVPLEELIDRLVKENKVVAFIKGSRSAPLCGFSQRVISILESEGIDYESVDVLDEEYNSGLRETLKKYSNWPTFPQIFVGGELFGGCDILTSMYEKGELASLFKK